MHRAKRVIYLCISSSSYENPRDYLVPSDTMGKSNSHERCKGFFNNQNNMTKIRNEFRMKLKERRGVVETSRDYKQNVYKRLRASIERERETDPRDLISLVLLHMELYKALFRSRRYNVPSMTELENSRRFRFPFL